MDRITVRLTDQQSKLVKRVAEEPCGSVLEIIRLGIMEFLADQVRVHKRSGSNAVWR